MMVELTGMEISEAQFAEALSKLEKMSIKDRAALGKKLGGREARSYYAETSSGNISLKLVTRLAYKIAGKEWEPGEGLQSKAVYQRFKRHHTLLHTPTRRSLAQQEGEEREYVSRLKRDGQDKFRAALLEENPICALTGCRTVGALEAAHINPVADGGNMRTENGFLLRADIHRLFDLGYLAIDPNGGTVSFHSSCVDDYRGAVAERFTDKKKLSRCRKAFRLRWKNRKRPSKV